MGRFAAAVLVIAFLGLLLLQLRTPTSDPGDIPASSSATGTAGGDAAPVPSGLVVTLAPCERRGDSLQAIGWVRNGLGETVRYVEIEITWQDPEGREVEIEFIEVVGGETMMTGDSASFRVATTDPRPVGCTAEVLSYDPFY